MLVVPQEKSQPQGKGKKKNCTYTLGSDEEVHLKYYIKDTKMRKTSLKL